MKLSALKNSPEHVLKPQQVIPRATPARALFAFAAAFFAVALMTTIQSRQRVIMEVGEAYTGLGDRAYFEVPLQIIWEQPVTFLDEDEAPLYLQAQDPIDKPDHQMLKVAWPRQRFFIYRDPNQGLANLWYLKVSHGKYLPLGLNPISGES